MYILYVCGSSAGDEITPSYLSIRLLLAEDDS